MKDPFSRLRQQAEQRADMADIDVSALSEAEIKQIIQDLAVHRIELEMQNDELQRANKDLENAKRSYVELFDFAPVGYLTIDQEYRITRVNLTFARLIGFPRERLMNIAFTECICPDFQDVFHFAIRKLAAVYETQQLDLQLRRGDRTLFWVHVEMASRDRGDTYLLSISDITRQKEAEQRYELLSNVTFEGIMVHKQGVALDVNASCSRLTGYAREEVIGKNLLEFLASDKDREKARRKMIMQEAAPYVIKARRKDGSMFDAELEARNIEYHGESVRIVAMRDITARKRAEDALKASEATNQRLADATFEAIFFSEHGICTHQNNTAERMFGYTLHEAIGKPAKEWIHPDYRELVKQKMKAHVAAPYEAVALRKDGTTFPCEIQAKTAIHGDRKVRITALRDITERKRAEEALQANEERFRAIFEQAAAGIVTVDQNGCIIAVNQRLCEILGYAQEELLQLTAEELTWPEDMTPDSEYIREVIAGKRSTYQLEKRYRHKDGHPVWTNLSSNVVRDEQGNIRYVIGVIIDISDRKQAEAALKEALAEKEILLKEIHHRVKNNMQTIASLLYKQQQHTDDKHARAILDDSIQRIKSMALIHEQIYRSRSLARINLAEYISHFANKLVKTYRPEGSSVTLSLKLEEVYLPVDTSLPVALILNELIVNALKYAFPDARSGEIGVECHTKNHEITLVVRDNGVGLPDHFNLDQTNTLGLYLVYNLVTRQLGGTIEIQRKHPTTFAIKFNGYNQP